MAKHALALSFLFLVVLILGSVLAFTTLKEQDQKTIFSTKYFNKWLWLHPENPYTEKIELEINYYGTISGCRKTEQEAYLCNIQSPAKRIDPVTIPKPDEHTKYLDFKEVSEGAGYYFEPSNRTPQFLDNPTSEREISLTITFNPKTNIYKTPEITYHP